MKKYPLRSNKEKWTSKETYHIVNRYIDLVKNYINALINQPTTSMKQQRILTG